MSSKRPAAPPPHIPGFTYVSLLGSGGFSDVYLYEQDRPRRKVAVKVLLSGLKTEGARRRFESEANLMAQLSSHPFIVTIFEAEVTDDGHSYLAMEYCSRPSLDVRYRRQRFSVDEVLAIGIQVASAVETAHRAGIAHRDIKPANILVTDYNRPALTDFGISGTLGGAADEDAGMSIPWSPPEQFHDGNVDGVLVDVWALGATLYTLLAGRSPFVLPGADNSQRELISRITSMPVPRLGRADVPESLELALATAMAKSATSRYSSAHAFALALQRIQAELNLSVTPFEVLEERQQEDDHADDGVEETRVRNVASIDPEKTGSAPTFPARTWPLIGGQQSPSPAAQPAAPPSAVPWTSPSKPSAAPGALPAAFPAPAADDGGDWAQATVLRSSRPEPAPGPENPEPAQDHGKRNLWLAIAGGTLLVLAIVVGIIVASTAPQPQALPSEQPSKPPADALDDGSVPDVAKLAGSVGAGGKVRFTWTNPQPKQGDTYKWRIKTVKGGGNYLSTTAPRVDVSANPDEPTCVQVIIVRNDGSASPAGEDSIACV
ncbi:serine/threonine-protein kinase [Arthrobacter pascens]|uniref:serine/threonine-protein kinase n=1 Tax=Arthrobacter pascens TaxID=1677 RepID=UPI00196B0A26|nr:serine/threonine-protein kinase [Arthrobacter pascens]MBN3499191.1 serine/threonine protein kinase [Arthrobacter pascens]MDR6557132.1 serine/threonine protein kinase [Arthrobacter pascens]